MYERIRNLREDKDLSQQALADYLNCTQVCYSNYETGKSRPDVEMLEATDRGEDPCVISPVVLKNGELKKDAKALTLSQMQALMRHAREMAGELADQMLGGHTEILPVKEETRIPCEYCDYRNVCHFEPEKQDACFREIENLGMDDMRLMLENQSE